MKRLYHIPPLHIYDVVFKYVGGRYGIAPFLLLTHSDNVVLYNREVVE